MSHPVRRVVHIINNLALGGAERFLVQLAAAQAKLGWQVRVLTLAEPNPLAVELARLGIERVCMGRARLNDARLGIDLHRELRRQQPDVVHTHLFYADTFGRPAARFAGVRAVVSTEHSTEGGEVSRRRRAGMRATAGFAHRIVAVSEAVRAATAARLGLDPERILVIPNGIDPCPWAEARPLTRTELGLAPDARVVGCVGRLVEAKSYDVLLRGVARLGDPTVHLVIAGEGPLRDELQRLARELHVEVVWLGWRDDVPRLLKSLDLFAMPSRWEGHSMALLEAMAAGCACLVSDIPELADTLGEAGVHVHADEGAIAAALRALLDAPERRAALGQRALQAVRRFSIEASASRYIELYEELLGSHPIGTPRSSASGPA